MKVGELFQACLADAGVVDREQVAPAQFQALGAQFLRVFRGEVMRRLDNHAITRSMKAPWPFISGSAQDLWNSQQPIPILYQADVILLPLTRAALARSGALWKGSSYPRRAEAAESALASIEKATPPAPMGEAGVSVAELP